MRGLLPGLLLLALTGLAAACPTCQVGIGDEAVKTTLSGYIYSFCFMAACPFVIVGSVLFGLSRALRGLDEGAEAGDSLPV